MGRETGDGGKERKPTQKIGKQSYFHVSFQSLAASGHYITTGTRGPYSSIHPLVGRLLSLFSPSIAAHLLTRG